MRGWFPPVSRDGGLPRVATGSAPTSGCFGACTVFTCVAACLLAEPPEAVRCLEGFDGLVTSAAAPIPARRDRMERPVIRAGIAPAEDPSLFTAHYYGKALYDFACALVRTRRGGDRKGTPQRRPGQDERAQLDGLAIRALEQAVAKGYTDISGLRNNPDFDPLRTRPAYVQLVSSLSTGGR